MDRAEPAVARDRRPLLGTLLVLAAACLWGGLGVFGRAVFQAGVTPLEAASARAGLAFLVLAPFALARPRRFGVPLRHLTLFAGYGFIAVAFFYYVYLATIERAPIAVAAALLYTAPAFVVAFSWIAGWGRIRAAELVALAAVLAGVFLATGAARTLLSGGIGLSGAAIGLGLLSGLAYATGTVMGKAASGRYDALVINFYLYGFGGLCLGVLAPPWTPFIAHPDAVPALIGLALLPTLMANLFFLTGIRHLTAATASMLACIEPVVAAGLGVLLLDEAIGADVAVGVGVVVAAAAWLARDAARTAPLERAAGG